MGKVADQIEVKNVSYEYTVDSGRVLAIKDKAAAKALIEVLTSPAAKEKFKAVGFTVS